MTKKFRIQIRAYDYAADFQVSSEDKREALKTAMEGDFDTGNVRYKARERYSFGVSDYRGIFGVEGA